MIKVEVDPYCEECLCFEPEIERPETNTLYGNDPDGRRIQLTLSGDTIIRCKYRNRCRVLSEYIKKQN